MREARSGGASAVLAGRAKSVSKAFINLTSIASEELWRRAKRGEGRRERSPMPKKARQGENENGTIHSKKAHVYAKGKKAFWLRDRISQMRVF